MNILKPKKTTFNAPALVYRRFTRLESSRQLSIVYKCADRFNQYTYWVFDKEKLYFSSIDNAADLINPTFIVVNDNSQVFQFGEY